MEKLNIFNISGSLIVGRTWPGTKLFLQQIAVICFSSMTIPLPARPCSLSICALTNFILKKAPLSWDTLPYPKRFLLFPFAKLHLDANFSLWKGQTELDWRAFYTCNVSVKKSFLVKFGLFEESLRYHEDVELGARLAPMAWEPNK